MNNTLDSSNYEITREDSSESFALLSQGSDKQVSKISSNELLQVPSQGIKVYLRFKPENDYENKLQDETYSVVSQSTLLTKFPNIVKKSARNVKKSKSRDNSIVKKKVQFTNIFDENVSQETIFKTALQSDVEYFLSGQNFTIITYGTTNSGKTYTMFGTENNPGIIPRSIEFIFANINAELEPKFKPIFGNKVILCHENSGVHVTKSNSSNKAQGNEYTSNEIKNSVNLKNLGHDSDMIHSIWLSFGEIYNEAIYDLLSEDRAGKDTRLKLVPDKDGTVVKGLKIVHAASALEAHQILTAAISKLRIAASSFNHQSSRSHSIFTIRLLKYYKDSSADDVKVYTLNFHDLAGSGRFENANDNDQNFIESRYINKSLLALSRCMKIIAENYATKQNNEIVGPFRESNLTRLLQKSFCGKEALTIFVNLNTTPAFYVETQNILRVVASLRKILHSDSQKREDYSTNSISRATSNWDVYSEYTKNCEQDNETSELREQNEVLMKELTNLKSSIFVRECEIRQEFANMYVKMIQEHDDCWRKQMEELDKEREKVFQLSVQEVEDYYEEKINNIIEQRKRIENIETEEIKQLMKNCCENCKATILSLEDIIEHLKKDLEMAVFEKNNCKLKLMLIEKELHELKDVRNSMSFLESSNISISSVDQIDKTSSISFAYESEKSKLDIHTNETFSQDDILNIQLQEMNEKLKSLELNLTKSETEKIELVEKLSSMEQLLINNNISFNLLEPRSELSENDQRTYRVNENSDLSFLYANCNSPDPSKIVVRVPKSKFSILSEGDDHWTILECSGNDKSAISSDSSKNDSGITSEGFKSDNEEKDISENVYIQNKVTQLKNDYTLLKDVHHSYRSKISDLSKEVEKIKHLMSIMKESASDNEQLLENEKELFLEETQIARLQEERKNVLQDVYCQTSDVLESKSDEYIKTMQELNERLKVHEDNNLQVAKFFEVYKDKSHSLENQIFNACSHFDNIFKYFSEFVPKLDGLINDLTAKDNYVAKLIDQIAVLEKDLSSSTILNEKIRILEEQINEYNEQKTEVNRRLNDKLENELCFDTKLNNLSKILKERDNEIERLKTELETAVNDNAMNKEDTKRLDDAILVLNQKMIVIKKEQSRLEEIRINLERTMENKIASYRSHLLSSDEDVTHVNSVQGDTDCKQFEINRLKAKLEQQDEDMCVIKESRDVFMERYKSLIEKLQNGEEVQIPDDADTLVSIIQNKTIKSDSFVYDADCESTKLHLDSNISNEANVIVVKSCSSKTSIGSSLVSDSSSSSTTSLSKPIDPQPKSSNFCWIQ